MNFAMARADLASPLVWVIEYDRLFDEFHIVERIKAWLPAGTKTFKTREDAETALELAQ